MAARIKTTRVVVRVVHADRHGDLVLSLTPDGIYIRRPRQPQRLAMLLPYGAAYTRAAYLKADLARREKEAARKAAGKPARPRKRR